MVVPSVVVGLEGSEDFGPGLLQVMAGVAAGSLLDDPASS